MGLTYNDGDKFLDAAALWRRRRPGNSRISGGLTIGRFWGLLVQDGQKANLRNALELLAAGLMASRRGGKSLLSN